MKVLIIEDEPLSAEHLETLLGRISKEIEVVGKAASVKNAISLIVKNNEVNVLFLDIHLSDGLSFDIFKELPIDIPIIFTTAYNEYAVKAFKLNSIDYLLKPIDITELKAAIEKYKKYNPTNSANSSKKLEDTFNLITKQYKTRFMVKIGDNLSSVKIEEVAFFSTEDGTQMLTTKQGKRYTLDYTLNELEELIDLKQFFRINRKVLLNIDAIKKVSSYFNSRYKLVVEGLEDELCVVSRERVPEFKDWLDG